METTTVYTDKDLKEAFDAGLCYAANLSDITFPKWLFLYKEGIDVSTDSLEIIRSNHRVQKIVGEKTITINAVLRAVSKLTGIPRRVLRRSNSRAMALMAARHIAYYLCYNHVSHTVDDIAKRVGGRTHGTVITAVQRMKDFMEVEEYAREQIQGAYDLLTGMNYNTSFFIRSPKVVHSIEDKASKLNIFTELKTG